MTTSSYESQTDYIANLDTSSIVTPGTWDEIARARSLDLMNSASSAENLERVTNQYKFDTDHVDEDAGFWTGWTENSYVGRGRNYGGAVRTAILSGSSAALKNLYVDYEIDAKDILASNDVQVGNNLYVGNNAGIRGGLVISSDVEDGDEEFLSNCLASGAGIYVDATKEHNYIHDLEVDSFGASSGSFEHLEATREALVTGSLIVSGTTNITGALGVNGPATFQTTSIFKKDVYVEGNLFVEGSASYINVDQLYVEDKSITVASGSTTAEEADGAGFDIAGANVEFHYNATEDRMELNKDLYVSESIIAPSGSIQNISGDSASYNYFSGSFEGDGSKLTGLTMSIASSSKYRYPITIEPGESGRYTYPFYTPDVLVQVYEWNDPDFTPEWGISGSEFDYTSGSIQFTEADIRVFASESVLPDTDVPTHYAVEITNNSSEPLNGYIVVADAGMMITGSIDILECTTDIAEFNVPGVPGGNKDILEFSHRLGTKNVIVSFYRYDDIQDGMHTIEPIELLPAQVSIPDKNHIKVVFDNSASISGYMVIAKAGHVVKESQIDDSWLQNYDVHFGDTGSWLANQFSADTGSFGVLGVSEYIDTPKIGNLNTGEQYYQDYYGTPLWGSYMEFTDRGIASYVRNYGETSGSTPEDYSEDTALSIPTASLLDSNGDLYLAGGVITNHASFNLSDVREKHNIKTLTGSLDNIKKLRGVEFEWNKNNAPEIGTIAQEVQSIYPKLTRVYRTIEGEERLAVNYDGLVGVLIEAVKELSGKVDQLSQELEQLRNK